MCTKPDPFRRTESPQSGYYWGENLCLFSFCRCQPDPVLLSVLSWPSEQTYCSFLSLNRNSLIEFYLSFDKDSLLGQILVGFLWASSPLGLNFGLSEFQLLTQFCPPHTERLEKKQKSNIAFSSLRPLCPWDDLAPPWVSKNSKLPKEFAICSSQHLQIGPWPPFS